MNRARVGGRTFAALLVALSAACRPAAPAYDLLLTGGTVIDGTGAPRRVADVAIRGDRIVAIGASLPRRGAARVVNASGQIVSPGFWDNHAHLVTLADHGLAENFVRQGITTVLAPLHSQDQPFPMDQYRAQVKIAPNVGLFAGHTWIRKRVMGLADRAPTTAELAWMRALVDSAMTQGALGLSTGLEYVPANYANVDEVASLAAVASQYGGIYVTHLRDEGPAVMDALRETLEVGRRAQIPVQVNHLKVTGAAQWGWSVRMLALLDSDLMFPPWALADGAPAFAKRVADPATRARLVREMRVRFPQQAGAEPSSIQFREVSFDASLAGKTLADYLVATGQPVTLDAAVEALIALQLRGGFIGIFHGMDEADVARFLTHPGTMVETDGDLVTFGRGFPHPRSYGAFPRVLGTHVRERQQLTLEAAVQRMTSLPAQWLGIRDRGTLAVGQRADITVFNADQIIDRATYTAPHQWPEGIQLVAVNGTVVFDNGRLTGALPGTFLARGRAAR